MPRSVFGALFLSAFIYFLAQVKFMRMCCRAAKAPDCKSGGHLLRRCKSYHMHQFSTGKGSLTGKAVVPKTTARCRLQVQVLSLPPNWTCSSAESERDTAKVEVVRSSRTRSTINEPVVQLESEQSSSKRQVAGSSPAGFTMPA